MNSKPHANNVQFCRNGPRNNDNVSSALESIIDKFQPCNRRFSLLLLHLLKAQKLQGISVLARVTSYFQGEGCEAGEVGRWLENPPGKNFLPRLARIGLSPSLC
jgi:hypothetical protein